MFTTFSYFCLHPLIKNNFINYHDYVKYAETNIIFSLNIVLILEWFFEQLNGILNAFSFTMSLLSYS